MGNPSGRFAGLTLVFFMASCVTTTTRTILPVSWHQAEPDPVLLVPFPECRDNEGNTVEWWATYDLTHNPMAEATYKLADAMPVNEYNRDVMANLSPLVQELVLEHECGHQENGDVRPGVWNSLSAEEKQEREQRAYCRAINVLFAKGYTERDFDAAIPGLARDMHDEGFSQATIADLQGKLQLCLDTV